MRLIMRTSINRLRNRARFRAQTQDKMADFEARKLIFFYNKKERHDLAHDTRIFIRDLKKALKRNLGYGNIILPKREGYRDIWRFNTDKTFVSSDIAYIYSKLQKAFTDIDSAYLSIRFCRSWWEDFNGNYHYNLDYLTRMSDELHIVEFNLSEAKHDMIKLIKEA